ncbi:hypothetical protein TWF225_007987 [Orbilia oligospora]|nr:hypothetical protein TWF225_007987 [Orbilia oligospora]KAF3236154.1 hypothetical protein TWF128_001449 [Orbilia oligospora]KAF3247482.1 hypothetical protein TWF217_009638 [Orbilia oligospora]KAF3276451.1 hypothetical protein TWF132_002211 [Orbilia oligospora]
MIPNFVLLSTTTKDKSRQTKKKGIPKFASSSIKSYITRYNNREEEEEEEKEEEEEEEDEEINKFNKKFPKGPPSILQRNPTNLTHPPHSYFPFSTNPPTAPCMHLTQPFTLTKRNTTIK